MCGRTDHDDVDVVERRERIVDRDELDLAFGRQRRGDLLGDLQRVPEPGLVDHERSHGAPPVSFSRTVATRRCRRIGARADPFARTPHLI
jgi:hypothetical protein